jgi:hypothetical protein
MDSDFVAHLDKKRSLTGYVFTTLQHIVSQFTTEEEYMAIVEDCKHFIWLKCLYAELCGDDFNLLRDSTV